MINFDIVNEPLLKSNSFSQKFIFLPALDLIQSIYVRHFDDVDHLKT